LPCGKIAGWAPFLANQSPDRVNAYQPLRAPRGAARYSQGWQQEAVLRLLLNSLDPDVAERPQDLVLSGAGGKAAADCDSFHSIAASLRRLAGDETLRIESGKPIGASRTTAYSPRVLATSSPGGGKLGDWLYTGPQNELPVLDEIYGAAAQNHFGGTLAGRLVLGGGMGGAGGAQPLAAALHGAAFLGIDADAGRIKRRVKAGYCEAMVNHLDEALRMLKNAARQRKSASVGLIGNCAELFPELARRGVVPDLLTDYTPANASFDGYIAAASQPPQDSLAAHTQGLRDLEKLGTRVIDPTTARGYLRPLLADRWRLTTWLALSGEPADIARLDRLAMEMFPADQRVQRWLAIAGKYVRFQGLPARVAWLKQHDLGAFAHAANDLVARGELSAPALFGCRFPPAEAPGADPGAPENGACWVWHSPNAKPVSPNQSSAQAIVADGSAEASERVSLWPAS
jgi:urocanate hydratase